MELSLFSKIIKGEIPASFTAKQESWVAFLDINPRAEGHTLVVPVEQKQRLRDLSKDSQHSLMEGVAMVSEKLCNHFGTSDCTIVVHDGPAAGQEIPHVHVHVIPRSKEDGGKSLLAMFPDTPHPGKLDPDFSALATLAEQLSLD
ncbi:MAG TPA: HIT family protein [Candidatus Thalassarchaeaceae archaeon]|nr:HIT family protein [Candidatus Thalassarchaeaceae archaeon]DAC51255.1 MAG TPA: HIT family protein [Candidatus Poseidoniales archaeon]HIH82714.1 HIT family protein [Candidatus Thalassarchaeaceae archaeon]|tara:strand:- start:258 stop:692 length:435 start_codon:yes stop_codon:yes gene_type:complete